jgi:site-specific DNA-cytosine methylase
MHQAVFDRMFEALMSITYSSDNFLYHIHWRVYYSQDFIMPQYRERAHPLGIHKSAITKRMQHATFFEHMSAGSPHCPSASS